MAKPKHNSTTAYFCFLIKKACFAGGGVKTAQKKNKTEALVWCGVGA
jgi:hypothetical protein